MPSKNKGGTGNYKMKTRATVKKQNKLKEEEKRNKQIQHKIFLKEQKHRPKSVRIAEQKRNTSRQEKKLSSCAPTPNRKPEKGISWSAREERTRNRDESKEDNELSGKPPQNQYKLRHS